MSLVNSGEYGENKGSLYYCTQNKFGTDWVNKADNAKGWTVDFNLRVSDVHNSELISSGDGKAIGVGVYVNDGKKQETINFLTQQIIFSNINQTKIYDATQEVNYRLTGKKDNLKLYARPDGASSYRQLADVNFLKEATPNGNALNPSVFEDVGGNLHVVWWDDGGSVGNLFYSKFDGESWSKPEDIVSLDSGSQFPSLAVDSNQNIYVAFESKQTEGSVIGFVYKNNLGWSEPSYIGVDAGYCRNPQLIFDSQSNVCVIWEDSRQTHSEIYINTFLTNELMWKGEEKLSDNDFGSARPSISSYMDEIFISWTSMQENGTSLIEIMRYNSLTSQKTSVVTISTEGGSADYSNILCNVSGRVFVVWHNNVEGDYRIYSSILSSGLDVLTSSAEIVNGHGGARHPVLSEQLSTGDIYIVWQDFKDGSYREIASIQDPSNDPYLARSFQDLVPQNSAIYVAGYIDGNFESSGNGSFDVKLIFINDRNTYMPSVPDFFSGELPILYESYALDEYGFLDNPDFLKRIRCAFYSLDRSSEEFLVNYQEASNPSGIINKDYILNKDISTKEIRFGDFSDVLTAHYVFKNFKYYLEDAVEPYKLDEVGSNIVGVDSISAHDVVINNYGNGWIVGLCGMYYFYNNKSSVVQVGKDILGIEDSVDDENLEDWKKFRAIAFDKHNNMFVGGEGVLMRYSINHINGFKVLSDSSSDVTSLVFDKNNRMYVGTSTGLLAYILDYEEGVASGVPTTTITISSVTLPSTPPTSYITSLKVDDNNCLWIGARDGVYRFYKDKFYHFTTVHGMASNRVNDIAIRNTAIRYVATSNGISKMVGFNFENVITSEDDYIWNNNVKSVAWREPNILYSGTLSRINQISVDDIDGTYSTVFYQPGAVLNLKPDDLNTYYLVSEDVTINSGDIIEVYINGNKIHHGYDVGTDNKTIRFRNTLDHNDVVEVIIRGDLEQILSFSQTQNEKISAGSNIIRIKDLTTDDSNIYMISEGDENEVKINDSDSILPFDRIHLDTVPPYFIPNIVNNVDLSGIKIGDQVDRSIVKVRISGATDSTAEIEGSGIDTMVISNNDQFLADDGTTPLTPVPFSTSVNHNLGLSLEQVVKDFSFTDGEGTVVSYIRSENELYAGSSKEAKVYKYNWEEETWEELFDYGEDKHIDFIEKYNNNLMISVGHDTDPAIVYVYNYTVEGLVENTPLPLSESRGYAFHELDGKFYIGAGTGQGDEYSEGSGSNGGTVYLYDDGTVTRESPSLSKVVDGLDDNVYALTSVAGSSNLLAASGPDGYIYEVDIENQASFIIYNSSEPLVSLLHQEDIGETFTGGFSNGIIRRSIISNNTYDISFRTVPAKISVLKIFPVVTGFEGEVSYETTFAAVGNTIYYLSESGTWVWKYTHDEVINDMTFDTRGDKNILYVVSDSGITRIHPLLENKVVYLKLIDRAGNETTLNLTYDADGEVVVDDNPFVDGISISSLVDFVSENKIFELDDLGNTIYTLTGDDRFYSAGNIEEERGEYVSEIFDGTNDLVKWETISWDVSELFNTQCLVYVRTSTSNSDILTATWQGPYYSYQSSGVNLSHLSGQFIQFKAVLISTEKGITPTFHRATIRAVTSESIHFFTTNFVMSDKINKGILTSQKIVPVAADVVFGINTTNSIDWTEYQQVDENRIFNVNQTGHNLRVGIKLISPNRSVIVPTEFGEYGPYNSSLYINTIDFNFDNNTGTTNSYHFRITLYSDINLTEEVFSAYSYDSPDGFSVDGASIPEGGVSMNHGESVDVLFSVPGSANITCETYSFVKIEYIYDTDFELYSDDTSFIASCTASFIDAIDFDFTNIESGANYYHFRIKFYQDIERTNEYLTVFSGNDTSGWMVDDTIIPESGVLVAPDEKVNIVYRPDPDDFDVASIYYLTIEAHDGSDYVLASNSYTFQIRDVQSAEYCGGYSDVPIIKNFGIMFELDNNEFITLNI